MANPRTLPAGADADVAAALLSIGDWLPYILLPLLVAGVMVGLYWNPLKRAWLRVNPHRSRRLDLLMAVGAAVLLVVITLTAYAIDWADHEGRDWLGAGLFLGVCALIIGGGFALKAWLDRRSRRG